MSHTETLSTSAREAGVTPKTLLGALLREWRFFGEDKKLAILADYFLEQSEMKGEDGRAWHVKRME